MIFSTKFRPTLQKVEGAGTFIFFSFNVTYVVEIKEYLDL